MSKRIEIADMSSDDNSDDDCSDVDGDFQAIRCTLPKLCASTVIENDGQDTVANQEVVSDEDVVAEPDIFDWSYQTQLPGTHNYIRFIRFYEKFS